MMYSVKEWLSIPKEERLMMIRLTAAENISRQNEMKRIGA